MNLDFKKKLPSAAEIKEMYPLKNEDQAKREENVAEISRVFKGEDDRLVLIIGPCSADRDDAVMEYMNKLRGVADQVKDKIVIVPRIYTNKPRTTGEGYKGMLHQPDPNKAPDMLKGVIAIRKLHIRALEETGFSCADEMLYPENYRFLSDLLGYVAVGARSVENQQHRLVASGIDIPVGMKNPTSGDTTVMMNSIKAAQGSHTFLFSDWEVQSKGNPLTHAILRGSVNKYGRTIPNYHYEDIQTLCELYEEGDYLNPGVIIDCNHSNSGKKYEQQIRIAGEVMHSCRVNSDINKIVKGLMIESYLVDGNQKSDGDVYGQSITDPCLGWEKTEKLIFELAEQR